MHVHFQCPGIGTFRLGLRFNTVWVKTGPGLARVEGLIYAEANWISVCVCGVGGGGI